MNSPHFIDTRTGRFGYLARGPADGRPVLCLHGFPDHAPSMVPLMDRLASAGYRAVAPWMRGYAPSVLEGPYHVDQLGDDIAALGDALWPGRGVDLVGHDWGAVATYAALDRHAEQFGRAVTMAVPHPLAMLGALTRQPGQLRRSWYMLFFQLPAIAERAVAARDYDLIARLWRTWSPGYVPAPDSWVELIDCLDASMPAPINYYRAMFRPLGEARERMSRRPPPITRPVLQLQGERDGCIAPSACRGQERFFAGEFAARVLDGVGHFMQLEAPDRVAELVIDWLDADDAPTAAAS